jgi:uncharacterized 2Fe-2S/4Fe-4S cluster protein (DUF4445 family)
VRAGAEAAGAAKDAALADPARDEAVVVFTPSGKRGQFAVGTPLLDAARSLGVDVDSVCGGRGLCGRCQITPSAGVFAKHAIESRARHLSPLDATEKRYAEKRGLAADRRLGCAARLLGDVVIDVPAESQVHRQVVRKRAEARAIEIDPVVRLHYVEVAPPDLARPSGDAERLCDALEAQWEITVDKVNFPVLGALQKTLREGQWTVTAAIREGRDVVGLWPGFRETLYGIAVDVGSTTVACHLCDLTTGTVVAAAGAMNPQIRFGEDLMSRVSYATMHPGGVDEMATAVCRTIDELAAETAAEAGIETTDIIEATVVGNPIMIHLVLGLDPKELGFAPFALTTDQAVTVDAGDLNLGLHPGARVYVLPCIAGHVGADAAAVMLSQAPHLSDDLTLIVDVGTNAEIVLGDRHRLLACSSPTGPAFEGAQISCGQRAAPGAIERVRIDRETLEPRIKVIGCDRWSDEAGFDEAVAGIGVTGICGSGIIEAIAEMVLADIVTAEGLIDGALAGRSPRVASANGRVFSYRLWDGPPELTVTQNDVRAIQLAKGALYAGARLLMDRIGVDTVERIILAGAFGSHIDPKYAMILGLIPDCDLARVQAAGNAAGTGARIALLNHGARGEVEDLVRQVEKVETAIEDGFQAHFVGAMAFPHATHPFPNLARAVKLPQRQAKAPRRRKGGRNTTPAKGSIGQDRPGGRGRLSPSK